MAYKNKESSRGQTVPIEEKGYSGELSTLGKLSYFSEYFDKVFIENSNIKRIVPIENPRESKSFKEGYQRAKALVERGFTQEHYHIFLESLRIKPKDLIEEIYESKKVHR